MSDDSTSLCAVEIENQSSSLGVDQILFAAKKLKWRKVLSANTILHALNLICSQQLNRQKGVTILICGSLFLAGQALAENRTKI